MSSPQLVADTTVEPYKPSSAALPVADH